MDATDGLTPSFTALDEVPGIRIDDPIERRQYVLYTSASVRPKPVPTDAVRFPVDAAAVVSTEKIRLGELVTVFVHRSSGELPVEVPPGSETRFEPGECHIELNATVKLYLAVSDGFTVEASPTDLTFTFEGAADVVVGARSYHERPAARITTTGRPKDVMEAISCLGSALKTTSPERAYPTLRGHPPEIVLGDRLHVPDRIERPETGVRIELPPSYASAFVVAPLAYYLGAEVAPGATPRLVTSSGYVHLLPRDDRAFEDEVERVLKQTFLLDCLVRTEGYYRIRLGELEALRGTVDLDLPRLYESPLDRRIERYLAVPYDDVEPELPTWALTAHIPPDPGHVEAIPFAANELAVVRSSSGRELSSREVRCRMLDWYFDDAAPGGTRRAGGRSAAPAVVEIEHSDSLDDAWFGDGVALGATLGVPQAYRNRFERTAGDGEVEIAVVCNEGGMADEGTVATDVYGSCDELPFRVALHEDLDRDALGELLRSDVDFLHYVGHISVEGFHCRDGVLDAKALSDVGPDVFFLNGCESYRPGRHLIDAGSVGGVVTVGEVLDSGAAAVGGTMARLLNLGFPLRTALSLARDESIVGGQYVVLGDGNADVAAATDGAPLLCDVEAAAGGCYRLTVRTFLPREAGMGATVYPTLESNDRHFLAPSVATFRVTEDELADYLEWHPYPVRREGELVWNERVESLEL